MKHSEVIELLKELIAIESPYYKEADIMQFCYNWLKNEGFLPEHHYYSEKKAVGFDGENIICKIKGQPGGPTICLNGHLDTVPLCKGWTYNPYEPTIDGDRIYGLGAVDMKGGCAALMIALKRLKNSGIPWKGNILLTLVSDEEGPFGLGANALIEDGLIDRIDCSVITEPSAGFSQSDFPVLCLGARGCFVYNIDFYGKAAHASSPQKGVNAAIEAARFILESEKLQLESDGILGPGSFCILKTAADGGACSVPDFARVTVHRHIVTTENEESIFKEAEMLLKRAGVQCEYKIDVRPEPSPGSRYYKPYVVPKEDIYAAAMSASVQSICGKPATIDYLDSIGDFNYLGTRVLNRDGNLPPALIIGPDGGNIHSADEYATIPSVDATCDIVYDFLVRMMR